jgi:hypothetical protein
MRAFKTTKTGHGPPFEKVRVRVPSRPVEWFPIHHSHPEAVDYLLRVWLTPQGEWRSTRPEPPYLVTPRASLMPPTSLLAH